MTYSTWTLNYGMAWVSDSVSTAFPPSDALLMPISIVEKALFIWHSITEDDCIRLMTNYTYIGYNYTLLYPIIPNNKIHKYRPWLISYISAKFQYPCRLCPEIIPHIRHCFFSMGGILVWKRSPVIHTFTACSGIKKLPMPISRRLLRSV